MLDRFLSWLRALFTELRSGNRPSPTGRARRPTPAGLRRPQAATMPACPSSWDAPTSEFSASSWEGRNDCARSACNIVRDAPRTSPFVESLTNTRGVAAFDIANHRSAWAWHKFYRVEFACDLWISR